jgi:hypothetical protein
MLAVLGETKSDVESLVAIIKQFPGKQRASILRKGFNGCGELCKKAASHIRDFLGRGAKRFVICHDADGADPIPVRMKVQREVVDRVGLSDECCIVVPVQELEAWMISDETAISKTIPSLLISAVPQPETIRNPKEWLIRKSREGRSKPLYIPSIHNPKVSNWLDVQIVAKKCPSFLPFLEFIKKTG